VGYYNRSKDAHKYQACNIYISILSTEIRIENYTFTSVIIMQRPSNPTQTRLQTVYPMTKDKGVAKKFFTSQMSSVFTVYE